MSTATVEYLVCHFLDQSGVIASLNGFVANPSFGSMNEVYEVGKAELLLEIVSTIGLDSEGLHTGMEGHVERPFHSIHSTKEILDFLKD